MFSVNIIVADDVLQTTGLTQLQVDQVVDGIQQAAALWSRYIDGNNAVIDIALDFQNLGGSTLAQAGSSYFRQNNGPLQSEVINELNGQAGVFSEDGTFTVDLNNVLNDRFFFSNSLVFDENPGAAGQIDFLTLAAHELGHVLGFLSLSFEPFVVNNQFIGENAVAANGGEPVQLADGVHTAGGDLLSPSLTPNAREPLNAIHIAILKDIGVPIAQATNAADILYSFNQIDDNLNGLAGNDTLHGLTGDDTLNGASGNDNLYGGIGDDIIIDGSGNDDVFGGEGDDVFIAGTGQNDYDGGSGSDTVDFSAFSRSINVNLATGSTSGGSSGNAASNDTLVNIENLLGTNGNDTIVGSNAANTLSGGNGNDTILDAGGNDDVSGGAGDDVFIAGTGQNDYDGGSGSDTVDFSAFSRSINVNLATGSTSGGSSGNAASNDTLVNIENLIGTRGSDTLTGNDLANTFTDGGGNDDVFGGAGDDVFIAGTGQNDYDGGSGSDTIDFSAFGRGLRINLTDGTTSGGTSGNAASNDTLINVENLIGSRGADRFFGDDNNNTFAGGNGNDTLSGRNGDDQVFGEAGNDRLFGGSGADVLNGGSGNDFLDGGGGDGIDQLYGGEDADIFHFDLGEGIDIVNDFQNNIDTIEFDNFTGTTTTSAFISDFATVSGDNVIFNFGADGNLTVLNTTLEQLQNDIELV